MFEYFSAKAIEALNLAREEAGRLEFAQVDTEHVLLGLIAEGNGIAARALKRKGIDLRRVRVATEQLWGRGYLHSSNFYFSPECQALFGEAIALASRRTPSLVDTQDLLFALLKHPQSRAVMVLNKLGADLEELHENLVAVRAQVLEAPSPPPEEAEALLPRLFSPRLLTEAGRSVYDLSHRMALAYGHTLVGTEQLLVALSAVDEGLAAQVLKAHGLTRMDVEAVASRVIGRGSGTVLTKQSLSLRANEALNAAWREARQRHQGHVGTGHILLGLLGLDAGGALTIMDLLKINMGAIQVEVEHSLDDHPRETEPRYEGAPCIN